ncbi:MAG: HAD family hydrolase [Desulfovibrio sp.]|uniref:HAD family hydrolase n=1 Tax=Desulfovibrio sp. 7SRBS1 TaxID=3378064 RepID=UPI003B3FDA85
MTAPIRCLVFDCDGVILESVDIKTRAFEHVFVPYGEEAVAEVRDFHLRFGGVNRLKKFAHVIRTVLGREMTQQESSTLNDEFSAFCTDSLLDCPLVDGFLEVAERWCTILPSYVASGAPQDELDQILKHKNLSRFFEGIYGSPHKKENIITMAAKRHGIDVASVLMIGDAGTDLDAASKTGSAFYGRGEFPAPVAWSEDLTGLAQYLATAAG